MHRLHLTAKEIAVAPGLALPRPQERMIEGRMRIQTAIRRIFFRTCYPVTYRQIEGIRHDGLEEYR